MTVCNKNEALRDYAFDELPAGERRAMQQHLAACSDCSVELDQIRLTLAALRVLPDEEIPQRIAFVSDKVFEPSPVARFFAGFWNSAARLGFASACVLALGLVTSAWHRPAEIRTVVQTAAGTDVSKQLNEAVAKAVQQVRNEDMQMTKAALHEAEMKHEREHLALLANVKETLEVMQERAGAMTLASMERPQDGVGQ